MQLITTSLSCPARSRPSTAVGVRAICQAAHRVGSGQAAGADDDVTARSARARAAVLRDNHAPPPLLGPKRNIAPRGKRRHRWPPRITAWPPGRGGRKRTGAPRRAHTGPSSASRTCPTRGFGPPIASRYRQHRRCSVRTITTPLSTPPSHRRRRPPPPRSG